MNFPSEFAADPRLRVVEHALASAGSLRQYRPPLLQPLRPPQLVDRNRPLAQPAGALRWPGDVARRVRMEARALPERRGQSAQADAQRDVLAAMEAIRGEARRTADTAHARRRHEPLERRMCDTGGAALRVLDGVGPRAVAHEAGLAVAPSPMHVAAP